MAEGEPISSVYGPDTTIGQKLATGDISGAEFDTEEALLVSIPEQRLPLTPELIGVAVVAYEMEPGGHVCPIDEKDTEDVQKALARGDTAEADKIKRDVANRHKLCGGCVGNDCGLFHHFYAADGPRDY